MKNRRNITGILLAIVSAVLFVSLICLCRKYQSQTKELQAELAYANAAKEEYTTELRNLQTQLAERLDLEESTTETGFVKKGGIYLIDTRSQLIALSQMIQERLEIESDISAAEASYRLRSNIELGTYWFSIGTEETPFCGNFDGDGHWIRGNFSRCSGNTVNALFQAGESAEIENLNIQNNMKQSPEDEVSISLGSDGESAEIVKNLSVFPDCRVRLSIYGWDFDTQKIAVTLRERWEKYQNQDGYYVSVFFSSGDETGRTDAMLPFHTLVKAAWKKIIDDAIAQEEGDLRFIKLEQIAGIQCCTFEIGELNSGFRRKNNGYHIIIEGEWDGTEVPLQHLFIPFTEIEMADLGASESYYIENVDINFDGTPDLLIHEGFSSGSGGSWDNYRAIVWDRKSGQFVYYPSFPEQLACLEFDRQRVINRGQLGVSYQFVSVYGVVDGEYTCTEELIYEYKYSEAENDWISILSYYKMGKLVRTHYLSDSDANERDRLYPDLDYWLKG